jgi:hypothetical protein
MRDVFLYAWGQDGQGSGDERGTGAWCVERDGDYAAVGWADDGSERCGGGIDDADADVGIWAGAGAGRRQPGDLGAGCDDGSEFFDGIDWSGERWVGLADGIERTGRAECPAGGNERYDFHERDGGWERVASADDESFVDG